MINELFNGTYIVKRKAFTLAEVLITLGIIGVVAAMTIPTLIANANGQKFRNQFKKTLSTLAQAGRMAQAQYGFNYASASATGKPGTKTSNPEEEQTFGAIFNGTLTGITWIDWSQLIEYSNKVKLSAIPNNAWFDEGQVISLADGSMFMFTPGPANCSLLPGESPAKLTAGNDSFDGGDSGGCYGWIDVNGISGPNKEVSCSDGKETLLLGRNGYQDCVVKNDANHMTDIFPVVFHDDTVEPASNAAKYVLSTAK